MSTLVITETEIQRRKKLAEQAMEQIKSCLPWESEEPNTIMTSYKGFYLQISISDVHPLIVFCFVRAIPENSEFSLERVNEVNLLGILGCHCINLEAGCYTYRTVTWLESELSRARLVEILDRCIADAVKGYINLLS